MSSFAQRYQYREGLGSNLSTKRYILYIKNSQMQCGLDNTVLVSQFEKIIVMKLNYLLLYKNCRILVEERRLEYADGYHDLVHDRGVESVDLLGRSQPASPSHLLSIIGTARKYISGNAIAQLMTKFSTISLYFTKLYVTQGFAIKRHQSHTAKSAKTFLTMCNIKNIQTL